MAVRILDKDITQVVDITQIVQIPRLSSRVLFLTREGRDGGMIYYMSRCFIYLKELTQFIFIGIPEESC